MKVMSQSTYGLLSSNRFSVKLN
ncbi:uncharacterized protein CELE_K08E5.5 [Caenorhabditis elegans]|uniref:Uncharacterized protein n=1 Tax=Caenorhabditis elegans TaxID=6239 RepID=B2MZB3_CAEEL|nr:Uncharacterized protein CELE_K08E5.5 [Caenorhabditis elegans]CAQ48394.1 Uncharacterized protein CELE_K08E5.5 [Caenorhabditis elegans]|eukprot:NP_001129838.1 Uncharacterized protein CELE_K08E5.5 [Caenorhabditis elegans]